MGDIEYKIIPKLLTNPDGVLWELYINDRLIENSEDRGFIAGVLVDEMQKFEDSLNQRPDGPK